MKHERLRRLIFMALCCDLGIFGKRLIAPATNILNDIMHIPGGLGTAFSLMFIVMAAAVIQRFGCGVLMGAVQSAIALGMGTVGSMGALAPIGYILPALVIDCVLLAARKLKKKRMEGMIAANALSSAAASLVSNAIVFRLSGWGLALYLGVSVLCGILFGVLGCRCAEKLEPILGKEAAVEKH